MNHDADALWDHWCRARAVEPLLEPVDFAAGYGDDAEQVLEELGLAMLLEEVRPMPLPIELEQAGELCFGPFRIQGELGRGGFGIVFDAVDEAENHVALKVVNPLVVVGGRRQEALLDEARLLSQLDHPGIVRLIDCGRQRGFVWFAMERVDGVPLDRLPPLDLDERLQRVVDLGLQLARALEAAHASGVVHRDLKPSNVLVTDDGRLRILDFGLARRDEVTVTVGRPGHGAGTPAFMAPEQLAPGGLVGQRTDLHGAGYLLLLLARPEVGSELASSERLTRRRLGQHRDLPTSCYRGLPANLRAIVQRCLEPHAEDRYASASELAEDLEAFGAGARLPHGRPGALWRGLRWVCRHPVRCAATSLFAPALFLSWYLLVWEAPVPIRISSFLSGKTLWLDGKEVGITPLETQLRSGHYRWQLQYGGPDEPLYSGWLDVQRGQPAAYLYLLNPAEQDHWVDAKPYEAVPAGAGAWLQVAVCELGLNAAATLTGVPGHGAIEISDYANLRLPFGEHRLVLSAPGYRPLERVFDVEDQQMHFWSAELDAVDSPWSTVTVYGPLEEQVRQPVEKQNLRVYLESEELLETGMHAYKSYFGPLVSGSVTRVGFWIDLHGEVLELEVEAPLKSHVNIHSSTWVRLEMGPDPDSAFPVAGFHGNETKHVPEVAGLAPNPRGSAEERRLVEEMRGRRQLFVRYVIGPTLAGGENAYGNALRAEAGPKGESWEPALRLSVRHM